MSWTQLTCILLAFSVSVMSAACDGSAMTGAADAGGPDADVDIHETSDETSDGETIAPDVSDSETSVGDDTDSGDVSDVTDETDSEDVSDVTDETDSEDVSDVTDVVALDTSDTTDTVDPDTTDTVDPDTTDTVDPDTTDTVDPDTTDTVDPDTTDTVDPDTTDTVDPDASDVTDTVDLDTTDTISGSPFDDLIGLTGDELRLALRDRIDDQSALGYSPGRAREVMFSIIDAHDGRVECIYTGRTGRAEDPDAPPIGSASLPNIDTTPGVDCRYPDGSPVPGGCDFNTEHSWPRSLGADNEPASSDLHHLFSTWDMANNRRSNFPFGVTTCVGDSCAWHEGASELGTDTASRTVFEVRPKYRGDIARAQFYFAVRYGLAIPNTTEPTLREWHLEDPVDDTERTRNDRIALWQGNRNPFVDVPDFVDALFDF